RQAFRTWGPTRQNHDVEVEAYRLQASVRQHANPTAAGYGSYSVEARDGDVNTRTSQYVDHDGGLHFFRTWSQNHECSLVGFHDAFNSTRVGALPTRDPSRLRTGWRRRARLE